MRRIGRHRRRKLNRIIVLSAFCLLFVITAGYAAFSTNISLHVKGNILEGTRVIQEWDENSQTDFHSDLYKQNIVSITFLNNNNVPENAVESWNVSEDKERGTVKAWVVPNSSDSSKYDLYIGAKGKVIANEDSSNIFYDFRGVKEISFDNNYDTSNAINMLAMFRLCTSLTTLDLSSFDTSKVTNMHGMFNMYDPALGSSSSGNLTLLDLSGFNTSNVTDMNRMFANNTNLISIKGIESFNTSNVISMQNMFDYCTSLTELNLSNFDTQNVTDMSFMFSNCQLLKSINISSFKTSKVTTMRGMFNCCYDLTELNLSNFDTQNVTDMAYMFHSVGINLLNLCSFDTSNVVDMSYMFEYMDSITSINVGTKWNTSKVTNNEKMFYGSKVSSVTTGQCF